VTSDRLLPIGEVASRAGLRPSALRFYEEAGLLRPAARVAGRRRYDSSILSRLAVIRLLRDAGFTIREMRRLLGGGTVRQRWRGVAELKLREIDARIAEAQETRRLIERALACNCETLEGCNAVALEYGVHRARAKGTPRKPRSQASPRRGVG
jgi:MerR family transcriptional regulator, redox-sensitive transcriptional activator SoxR